LVYIVAHEVSAKEAIAQLKPISIRCYPIDWLDYVVANEVLANKQLTNENIENGRCLLKN